MHIPTLVEIKTEDFSAVLTKFNELPASKVMPIMMAREDMSQQAHLALDLFLSELSSEKKEEALTLGTKQIAKFMDAWMREANNEQ
jgi:hypothetical protein